MPALRRSNKSSDLLLLVAVVAALVFAIDQARNVSDLNAELQTARSRHEATLSIRDSEVAELEAQIAELTETLTLSTEKLQQATAALNTHAVRGPIPPPPPLTADEIRELKAAVKPPVIRRETDRAGGETKVYLFPELINPEGGSLAKDMEFSRLYGTKLAFRNASGAPASFEAEELHPGILAHLGIDLYDAQRRQQEWEEKIAKRKEDARQRQIARIQAEQKAFEARAEREAELRKERFEQQARLAEIENERTKALAAMKQADAAMIEAYKPPTALVNPLLPNNLGVQTVIVPSAPTVTGPVAQTANQVSTTQGPPQPRPFKAPTGQLKIGK